MAFPRGFPTGLSHVPTFCESILRVKVEAGQGDQCFFSGLRHLGDFGMVARPLEFLSTFLLRAPPLEMRREPQESFPNEAGKGTLILSYVVETGLLLMLPGPLVFLSMADA